MEKSKGENVIANVEAARGIAACLVLFYHAARHIKGDTGHLPFGTISQFGHSGVDFFFVLSGFIIMFVHFDDIGKPHSIVRYAKRRITRIYPLYWMVLSFTIFMQAIAHPESMPSLSHVMQDLALLPTTATIVGVAWTLQHELYFT